MQLCPQLGCIHPIPFLTWLTMTLLKTPFPPPKTKRPHALLTADERAQANAKKAKNKVTASEFLEQRGQCASYVKWTESEEALFSLLLPRFSQKASPDFALFAREWTRIHSNGGAFEGSHFTVSLRDRMQAYF